MDNTRNMQWYAIKTQNSKEVFVLERIKSELDGDGLAYVLGESIIPMEKNLSIKGGKKVIKDKIVMPGYIFLETTATGEVNRVMRNITGAGGFLKGRDGRIERMRQIEVDKLFKDHKEEQELDISSLYIVDEKVKVTDGAFSTFIGKVTDVDSNQQKLKLQIEIFGRVTDIELNFEQVGKT